MDIPDAVVVFSAQQLHELTIPILGRLCQVRGFDDTGCKAALIQRLCSTSSVCVNPQGKRLRPKVPGLPSSSMPSEVTRRVRHRVLGPEMCHTRAQGVEDNEEEKRNVNGEFAIRSSVHDPDL